MENNLTIGGDEKNLYFKPFFKSGLSLLQKCFQALGFPNNPIGKTIEILTYRTGTRYDKTGYTFEDAMASAVSYETVENYMSTIVAARAWPGKEGIWFRLFIIKEGDLNKEEEINLARIDWKFSVNPSEMTLKPLKEMRYNDHYVEVYPRFHDHVLTVDNLMDNINSTVTVAVRVLE